MTDTLCPDISAEAKMASSVERTDELVREYLIYRGFTSTLKHLDSEIKTDKEKGFRVRTKSHILLADLNIPYFVYKLLTGRLREHTSKHLISS